MAKQLKKLTRNIKEMLSKNKLQPESYGLVKFSDDKAVLQERNGSCKVILLDMKTGKVV